MIGVPTSSPLSRVTNINMGSNVDDDNKTEHLRGSVSAVRQADTEPLMRGDELYKLAKLTEQQRCDKGVFYFYPKSNFTKNICILLGGITIGSIVTGVINHFRLRSQENSQSGPDTNYNNSLVPYSQALRDSNGTAPIQDLGKSDCPPTYCPPNNCDPLFGEKISFDINKKVMHIPIRNPGDELKVLDDLCYEISHARKKLNDFLPNTSLIKSDEKFYELSSKQWEGIRNSLGDEDGTVERHRDTIFKRDAPIARDYFNTCNERVGEYVGKDQMDKFLQIPMDLPRIIEMVGDLKKVDLRACRNKFDLDELTNEVNKITLRMPTSATSEELYVTPHEIEYLSNIFKLIVEHKDTYVHDPFIESKVSDSRKEYQAQLEALDNLFVAYEPIKNGDSAYLKLDDWRLVVRTLTDMLRLESLTLGAEVNKLTLNLVDKMGGIAKSFGENNTVKNFRFSDSKGLITLNKIINDSRLNTSINNIMERTNDPFISPPLISGKEANEICKRLMELPPYCVTNEYINICPES
ncbi:hypothetical protein [Yersinia kristensenii]|uniref:hypothetical protein n=1 Tax=Yersinia kristensenii TaxID=28152 RepID=UPI0022FDC2D1|nr:hypothetical protein [Yersinia kristensenii]MDA5490260.1 hypothetical protein [Yersinia kristensenii]